MQRGDLLRSLDGGGLIVHSVGMKNYPIPHTHDQIGRVVEISMAFPGATVWGPVRLLKPVSSYGHKRWEVMSLDGSTFACDAGRLRQPWNWYGEREADEMEATYGAE